MLGRLVAVRMEEGIHIRNTVEKNVTYDLMTKEMRRVKKLSDFKIFLPKRWE